MGWMGWDGFILVKIEGFHSKGEREKVVRRQIWWITCKEWMDGWKE